jgi:hypothetical protein
MKQICQILWCPLFRVHLAVDLQLSIKVFGTDGLKAAGQPLYKSLNLRTAVCGPYNAKLLHCQLINLIPKNSQHILLADLCPRLLLNVRYSPIRSQKSIRFTNCLLMKLHVR